MAFCCFAPKPKKSAKKPAPRKVQVPASRTVTSRAAGSSAPPVSGIRHGVSSIPAPPPAPVVVAPPPQPVVQQPPLARVEVDRTPSDHSLKMPAENKVTPRAAPKPAAKAPHFSETPHHSEALHDVFITFATFAVGNTMAAPVSKQVEMDSVRLMKLCRESGLLNETRLNTTRVDLCFTKVKAKGARKINYTQFLGLVELMAIEAGVETERVAEILCSVDGPALNNVTKAEYNRFHDDKTTYTGVYARGGPTVGDEITAEKLVSGRGQWARKH